VTGALVDLDRAGHGLARLGLPGQGVARTAYTAVRVCGAHVWPGSAQPGPVWRAAARSGSPRLGGARQGVGRTACTQVRALSAHAWLGRAGLGLAGLRVAGPGRGSGRATSRPQGASPWRPRTARPGGATLAVAWLGTAGRGKESGRLAGIEVRVLDTHARQGEAWLGTAGPSEAGTAGYWQTRRFESCGPTRGKPGPGQARLGKAWRGKGLAGEWSTSEFESPTPTLGVAWRGTAVQGPGSPRPGTARKAGCWQTRRFESCEPT